MIVTILSVRQPWAELIVSGQKDIENRTRRFKHRGLLYIHASTRVPSRDMVEGVERRYGARVIYGALRYGGVIGSVVVEDVVTESTSRWFDGPFGMVLSGARRVPFVGMPGNLNIFQKDI